MLNKKLPKYRVFNDPDNKKYYLYETNKWGLTLDETSADGEDNIFFLINLLDKIETLYDLRELEEELQRFVDRRNGDWTKGHG